MFYKDLVISERALPLLFTGVNIPPFIHPSVSLNRV